MKGQREVGTQRQRSLSVKICTWLTGLAMILLPGAALASSHDTYAGDTAIYGSTTVNLPPNILIILDNSNSMADGLTLSSPYNPTDHDGDGTPSTYPQTSTCQGQPCEAGKVYKSSGQEQQWTNFADSIAATGLCIDPAQNSLDTTGLYTGERGSNCNQGSPENYATGNYINWANQPGGLSRPKIEIAKDALRQIVRSTFGVKFGVMIYDGPNGGIFTTANVSGSNYTSYVNDMDAIFTGSTTNRQALDQTIATVSPANEHSPMSETLWEARQYYKGSTSAFSKIIGNYPSPITSLCQRNYVVLISDGSSTADLFANASPSFSAPGICNGAGDCDVDGNEPNGLNYSTNGSHYLDDVAKYAFENDLRAGLEGNQVITTFTIGLGGGFAATCPANTVTDASATALLCRTADPQHGRGGYYYAGSAADLSEALRKILTVVLEVDTSFVAPVVPVSPENRTYSGSRVYLGFFKPISGTAFWYGNLKKYGIDDSGVVVDKNGNPATSSDGSFKDAGVSYWSTFADGGDVDLGGAGGVLKSRDFAASPRQIYTYMGTSTNLSHSSNAFTTANAGINATTHLDVADDTEKDKVINFVHGLDAYDANVDGNTTEKRDWILADILHSKPLVVNYAAFSYSSEGDCNANKTMVYAGANDGMLHAFRDCDGSEAWAFIPWDLLPNLKHLTQFPHAYYVDGSPSVYTYDADKDGNIEIADGDKAILIFGERRGGGFYYALDVSDPNTPIYLWRLSATESPSGTNTDYAELGQAWSEPELAKVKVGIQEKVAMIIGAGYDNENEDRRYGATQAFADITAPLISGEGNLTSLIGVSPATPKGRGVYIVEVATLDGSGVPSFTNSGRKVWGYTYANNSSLTFSTPSAVSVFDRDYNGFADRFYVGGTGGDLWRFDIGDTSTFNWTGRKIFRTNPGSGGTSDVGRKIFYKPSVILEVGYEMVFFGTGDREHPLNTAVVDRLYGIKDKGETGVTVLEAGTYELVDVTTNLLQESTDNNVISSILSALDTKYGWYIKLDQNSGEKTLAPALAFHDVYYTTYAPNTTVSADPCVPGNLGTARIYVVNNKTGEAAYNSDTSNDSYSTSNTRATHAAGEVLLRSDRVMTLASGIPSGIVLVITSGGDVVALVGCGGALCAPPPPSAGNTIPLYWRRLL